MDYRKCVVAVVIDSKGGLLAGRRSDHKEVIQLPQGGMEDGESTMEAAVRELHEETGILASQLKLVEVGSKTSRYDFPSDMTIGKAATYKGQELYWVCFDYIGEIEDIDLKKAVDDEFCELMWVLPEGLVKDVTSWKRAAYKAGLSQFNLSLRGAFCQE